MKKKSGFPRAFPKGGVLPEQPSPAERPQIEQRALDLTSEAARIIIAHQQAVTAAQLQLNNLLLGIAVQHGISSWGEARLDTEQQPPKLILTVLKPAEKAN